jgi:hypothetical protein
VTSQTVGKRPDPDVGRPVAFSLSFPLSLCCVPTVPFSPATSEHMEPAIERSEPKLVLADLKLDCWCALPLPSVMLLGRLFCIVFVVAPLMELSSSEGLLNTSVVSLSASVLDDDTGDFVGVGTLRKGFCLVLRFARMI